MSEHEIAMMEGAMNAFVDEYFKARTHLSKTLLQECLVAAGFKAAWAARDKDFSALRQQLEEAQRERLAHDARKAQVEKLVKTNTDLYRRLAEAEVQEAAAVVDADDNGLFVDIVYGKDGSALKQGDKLYLRAAPPASDERVRELVAVMTEARKELHACQAVIHLAGGFDPAYVAGAQAALKKLDAALAASKGGGA